jgi:hypothetical protein
VGIVDDAVEDSVGVGGIVDDLMPAVDEDLAGDDGGTAAISFFEDLEEIAPDAGVEGLETPIVENEQLRADGGTQEPGIAAVSASKSQLADELGHTLIEDGAVWPSAQAIQLLPTPVEAASYCRVSAFEVRITYPFHPRSGETVAVVGSRQHAGADHLIIR